MLNKEKINRMKYEDIPKSTVLGSAIRKTKNMFFGLAIGAAGLYGLSYYGFVNLKNKTEKIIETKLANKNVENYAMELVAGKTYDLFENNKEKLLEVSKNQINKNVDLFFTENKIEFKQELSDKFKDVAKKNGEKWFEEEKLKVQKQYKKTEIKINQGISIRPLNRLEEITQTIYSINKNIEYIIHVDKKNNITKLIDCDSKKIIYSFNSTDGRGGEGPKKKTGDNKTPEGVYSIEYYKVAGNEYNKLFGSVRLGINYPNNIDQKSNQNGWGILICGTGLQKRINAIENKNDATYGSIVLKDRDIIDLYNTINQDLDKTAIVIENPNRKIDLKKYSSEIRRI